MLALAIAAPFTLGLSLIPLAALGIGLGVSTLYSAARATENAAKAAREVTNLRLSEEDAIRLALFDYDNSNKAAADKEAVRKEIQKQAASVDTVIGAKITNLSSALAATQAERQKEIQPTGAHSPLIPQHQTAAALPASAAPAVSPPSSVVEKKENDASKPQSQSQSPER